MNLDLKLILPYVAIICSIGISWGMFSQRLDAVEKKADNIVQIQLDVAIIKERIMQMDDRVMWIEEFLIKTMDD
jgi:hypothetical protein